MNRRAETRVGFAVSSAQATLRPGCSVRVVDLSPGGALVEAERPLRPGARVHMQVAMSAGTFSAIARVLRCSVWAVHPSDGVTYRGALQFENRCEPIWERGTRAGADVPGSAIPNAARHGQALPTVDRTAAPTSHRSGT